jgi:hypothetical protein
LLAAEHVQADYPARFERDMACTEAEWLGWLPRALAGYVWHQSAQALEVELGTGRLKVNWHPLPPRVIALMRLPRLLVVFTFDGVSAEGRRNFMKHFDLYLQRGGG